ncbi:MAG TPA: diacylglycerol kinase family protein [Aeromicrobium sp.]|nr:diacylglycerol kinase family protein [Aeromicrobium sp.]
MTEFLFVVNPISGGGAAPAAADAVAKLLRGQGHGVRIEATQSAEDVAPLVAEATAAGHVVVSVGGDGMLASLAGVVAAAGGVMGLVPAGRGNDFARMLGLPTEPQAVADTLIGSTRVVDLLQVTCPWGETRMVAGSTYFGLDAIAGEYVERLRRLPKGMQYKLAALAAIAGYRSSFFSVRVDGKSLELTGSSVVVANSAYYGSGMKIAPGASVDDGLLDVIAIAAPTRRSLLKSLPKVYDGSHVELPEVHVVRGTRVELTAEPDVPFAGDGEPLGRAPLPGQAPVVIEVMPASLTLLAPLP